MTIDDERPPLHLVPPPDHDDTPPQVPANLPAERALLAHLLDRPHQAADLLPLITPTDFYDPKHELLWHTATHLHNEGRTPDHVGIISHLATTPRDLQRAGGHEYLLTLRDALTYTADPTTAADSIRDTARIRNAMTALTRGQQALRQHGALGIQRALEEAVDTLGAAVTAPWATSSTNTTGLVDLGWITTGEPPETPYPQWVERTDGTRLFYNGVINLVFGDPEAAKTWLAQCAIIEALRDNGRAAMIDLDHNGADHTAARLLRLGARPDHLADPNRFRYYEPEDPDQLTAAVTELTTWQPHVALYDSLGELLPLMGASSVDNDEITAVLRRTLNPVAKTGACVIAIDHLPKSHEARSTGYSIGGTAKKRMIRGAMIRAEVKAKPAPGAIGRITLRIEKDTLGGLRKTSGGGYVGTFVLDSTREAQQITTWEITREHSPITDDGKFRPSSVMELVSKYIEDNDGCTQRDIEEAIPAKASTVRTAIKNLLDDGFLSRVPGARRAFHHHVIAHYREAEDDQIQ